MSQQQYITRAGLAAETASLESGTPLRITHLLIGEGEKPLEMDPRDMSALVNQVRSYPVDVTRDPHDRSTVYANVSIPGNDGSFFIHEMGLQLDDGTLYTWGEGNGDEISADTDSVSDSVIIRIAINTANSDVSVFQVDQEVVYATFADLKSHDHPEMNQRISELEISFQQYQTHTHSKATVGLSDVENFGVSSQLDVNDNRLYATASAVYSLNQKLEDYKSHTHSKDSIGLGKVHNYPVSDDISQDSSEYYASIKAVFGVNQDLQRFKRDHTHTSASVGLANVGNYSISDTIDGTSSITYASSQAVKSVNDKFTNVLENKLEKTDKAADTQLFDGRTADTFVTPDVRASGRIMTNDHFETIGTHGLHNKTYGGTIFMNEPSLWRFNKAIFVAGGVFCTGQLYQNYSDVRLKNNIQPVTGALNTVLNLDAIRYTPNAIACDLGGYDPDEQCIGLKAHQVQKHCPELTTLSPIDRDKEGASKTGKNYLTVNYAGLVPVLVAAIQELTQRVEQLEAR